MFALILGLVIGVVAGWNTTQPLWAKNAVDKIKSWL
jgi:hypothetical protein